MEKMKYVRLKEYNSFIVFPEIINHSDFKRFDIVSAGFCYIGKEKVECFGGSVSLGISSKEKEDTQLATKQFCGVEAMIKIM